MEYNYIYIVDYFFTKSSQTPIRLWFQVDDLKSTWGHFGTKWGWIVSPKRLPRLEDTA